MDVPKAFYTSQQFDTHCRRCQRGFRSHDVRDLEGDGLCPDCMQKDLQMKQAVALRLESIRGTRQRKQLPRPVFDGRWINIRSIGG